LIGLSHSDPGSDRPRVAATALHFLKVGSQSGSFTPEELFQAHRLLNQIFPPFSGHFENPLFLKGIFGDGVFPNVSIWLENWGKGSSTEVGTLQNWLELADSEVTINKSP
jgi:hypothetical protein